MDSKSWYLSKTLWGAVIGLVGVFAPKILAALGGESAIDNAMNIAGSVAAAVGGLLAIYGRFKATTTLTK
jgi:hypothetical protein